VDMRHRSTPVRPLNGTRCAGRGSNRAGSARVSPEPTTVARRLQVAKVPRRDDLGKPPTSPAALPRIPCGQPLDPQVRCLLASSPPRDSPRSRPLVVHQAPRHPVPKPVKLPLTWSNRGLRGAGRSLSAAAVNRPGATCTTCGQRCGPRGGPAPRRPAPPSGRTTRWSPYDNKRGTEWGDPRGRDSRTSLYDFDARGRRGTTRPAQPRVGLDPARR
jgi:hypothetical protein